MYFTGIKPKEGLHLPDGVPVDSVLISSPYPSFHDESIEPMQELSYVADTQIADAAKLEELPMVSNKRSQFPLGTYDHILGPLLQGWAWVLVRRKKGWIWKASFLSNLDISNLDKKVFEM